jgi:hypothetical protein
MTVSRGSVSEAISPSERSFHPSVAVRRVPSSEIKPAQVHELKLQTQQMRQQTVILRTQLTRLESQIHSKSSIINQRLDPNRDQPQVSPTIHANTIRNLQLNVESARNTLATLKEEIEELESDDRTPAIDELEEELKFSYCEYTRLLQGVQDKKAAAAAYAKELLELELRGAARHLGDLRALVREVRAQNVSLREKANAFQLKIEKLNVEDEIVDAQSGERPEHEILADAQAEHEELKARVTAVVEKMNDEADEHAQKIARLGEIIQAMKDKIAAKLERDTEADRTE